MESGMAGENGTLVKPVILKIENICNVSNYELLLDK